MFTTENAENAEETNVFLCVLCVLCVLCGSKLPFAHFGTISYSPFCPVT
jgi:hypothetical protein